jgi:hypothetical protein
MTRAATAYLRLDQLKGDPAGRVREGQLRRVTLTEQTIDYRLIRARRRTIGMEVDLEGLTVRAPRWVTLSEIEAALVERANGRAVRPSCFAAASWRSRSIRQGSSASAPISST